MTELIALQAAVAMVTYLTYRRVSKWKGIMSMLTSRMMLNMSLHKITSIIAMILFIYDFKTESVQVMSISLIIEAIAMSAYSLTLFGHGGTLVKAEKLIRRVFNGT